MFCCCAKFLWFDSNTLLNTNYNFSHWFGLKNLSRTPSAWFSWRSKPDFRSCQITISYLSEIFFSIWKKCCYIQIFPNEVTVLIESFEKRFKATPFFIILSRWRKFLLFIYFICYIRSSWCRSHYPTPTIAFLNKKQVQVEGLSKSFKVI